MQHWSRRDVLQRIVSEDPIAVEIDHDMTSAEIATFRPGASYRSQNRRYFAKLVLRPAEEAEMVYTVQGKRLHWYGARLRRGGESLLVGYL